MITFDKALLKGIRILVVEDDVDLRDSIQDVLQIFGAETIEAANGKLAFEILNQTKVDLILSDVRMPGGDGVALLEEVRKHNSKEPPFLFLTGFSDLTEEAARAKGAQGILSKPFDSLELAKAISSQVESRPHY